MVKTINYKGKTLEIIAVEKYNSESPEAAWHIHLQVE